jgi:hypothetical protein
MAMSLLIKAYLHFRHVNTTYRGDGGAWNMHGRDEKCIHTIFWLENLKGRNTWRT